MINISQPVISNEEIKKIIEVLESGNLAAGIYVEQFEKKLTEFFNVKHAIATSSGTTALHSAIEAFGLEHGSEVITTPFTFIATSNSIVYSGLKPIFTDVDERTFNIDCKKLRRTLRKNPNVKALLLVHLYGLSCDMDEILSICNEYKLLLIEDCAQAFGSKYKNRLVGTFGNVGCFSFYPTKTITTGEGGAIIANDDNTNKCCRQLINHGTCQKYYYDKLGYNYRMTNIAGALGLCQIEKIDSFIKKRIDNANRFNEGLSGLTWLKTPYVPDGCFHTYNSYTIKVLEGKRNDFVEYLKKNEIGYGIYYPAPLHKQKIYSNYDINNCDLGISEKLSEEVISLPVHPLLNENDINYIINKICQF